MSNVLRVFEGRFGRVYLKETLSGHEPHSHAEHQLIAKYDGADCKYVIDGEQAALTRESLMFVNAGRVHETLANQGDTAARQLLVNISPDWLTQTFPSMFRDNGHGPYPRTHDTITPHIRRIADAMVIDMMNDRFLSADRLEFMVQELILSVIDSYIAKRRSTSPMWRGSKFA
ncbi:MAG: AraC family ligand binding domain-containing protein, partial [Betaproteobacteria bacterium]